MNSQFIHVFQAIVSSFVCILQQTDVETDWENDTTRSVCNKGIQPLIKNFVGVTSGHLLFLIGQDCEILSYQFKYFRSESISYR
jgi:hypothetical protein